MPVAISSPTEKERAAAAKLQEAVERAITERGLNRETLAPMLGLLPGGVDRLREQTWSLELAWRVAEVFGLDVRCEI